MFEAQERLSFFINSLAMKSAPSPSIASLQSVSTIVPCYDETIVFSYAITTPSLAMFVLSKLTPE